MKKILILFFCLISVLSCLFYFNPNRKIYWYEFLAHFKPTVCLETSFDIDDVKKIEIEGLITTNMKPDEKSGGVDLYIDKSKTEKIINYLNHLRLVEATKDELPHRSGDGWIRIYNNRGFEITSYVIYGDVFILDLNNDKLYRDKESNIISNLEAI